MSLDAWSLDTRTHRYKNYIRISATDMAENDKNIKLPYNAEKPLNILIEILNKYADFAVSAGETLMDTQLVCIAYCLVAETGHYLAYFRVWRAVKEKSWTAFQSRFIESQADLQERQQTVRQGSYRSNNLVVIDEAFKNLVQETAEDRATLTNLTYAKIILASQVEEYANHLAVK